MAPQQSQQLLASKLALHTAVWTGLAVYFGGFFRRLFPGTGTYPERTSRQIKLRETCAVTTFLLPPMHLAAAWMTHGADVVRELALVYTPHMYLLALEVIASEWWYRRYIGQPKAQIFMPVVSNPYRIAVLWDACRDIMVLHMPVEQSLTAALITAANMGVYSFNLLFNIMPLVPLYLFFDEGQSAKGESFVLPEYFGELQRPSKGSKTLLNWAAS